MRALYIAMGFFILLLIIFSAYSVGRLNTISRDASFDIEISNPGLYMQTSDAAIAEMRAIQERITADVETAANFLGLFEVMGVAISVFGVIIAVLGVIVGGNFADVQRRLEESLENYQERITNIESQAQRANTSFGLLLIAQRQYRSLNLDGALATYARAINVDSQNAVTYYETGYILTMQLKLEEAKNSLKIALESDSNLLEAKAALGYVYRRMGDTTLDVEARHQYYNKAEKLLRSALGESIALVDNDGESWAGSLAGLYKRRGDNRKAKYYYEIAQEVTPVSSYPTLNLALLNLDDGNIPEAELYFKRVESLARLEIRSNLDNYWAYGDLFTSQVILGSRENAQESLDFFLSLIPMGISDVLPRIIDTLEQIRSAYEKWDKDYDLTTIDWALEELRQANGDDLNDDAAPTPTD